MTPYLEIRGLDALTRGLERLAEQLPEKVGAALRAEAEIEMTEAKRRTPVKTGALRASGIVTGPTRRGDSIEVRMTFGGAGVDYAIEVHENLEMFHPRGGQAKFLESTVLESAPFMAQRVAERILPGSGSRYAPTASELSAADDAMQTLGLGEE
jgi:hypothetical protein